MPLHHFSFAAMACDCELLLHTDNPVTASSTAEQAIAEVKRIESRYSRYRPDSTLSQINATAQRGGDIEVDSETAALLDYAFACHRISDGLFDISSGILRRAWDFSAATLPGRDDIAALLPLIGLDKLRWQRPYLSFPMAGSELDFGGMAKEYAADRAAAVCREHGINHGLINLGGDLCAVGPPPDSPAWRIAIRDPRQPTSAITTVDLTTGALATSGDYERYLDIDGRRYCHLLNPRTGWPSQELRSVSIHAEQCLLAGSLASMAMLKGKAGIAWLEALGQGYFCVDQNGQTHSNLAAT